MGPVPGGLWARFWANVVDTLIMIVAIAGVGLATYAGAGEDAVYTAGGITYLVMIFLYAPLMLAFVNGQTVGKQALGVRVRNATGDSIGLGRALLRELVKLIFGVFTIPIIVVWHRRGFLAPTDGPSRPHAWHHGHQARLARVVQYAGLRRPPE